MVHILFVVDWSPSLTTPRHWSSGFIFCVALPGSTVRSFVRIADCRACWQDGSSTQIPGLILFKVIYTTIIDLSSHPSTQQATTRRFSGLHRLVRIPTPTNSTYTIAYRKKKGNQPTNHGWRDLNNRNEIVGLKARLISSWVSSLFLLLLLGTGEKGTELNWDFEETSLSNERGGHRPLSWYGGYVLIVFSTWRASPNFRSRGNERGGGEGIWWCARSS